MPNQYDPSELSGLEPISSEVSAAGQSMGSKSLAAGLTPSGMGFDLRGFARKFGRIALWGIGLFIVFLISAWVSLPTRSIAWRISHEARKAGFNISVDDVKVRPWGSVTLDQVKWSFKPARPGSTPIPFIIEDLDASVSVLKFLLFKTIDVEFEGTMDEGSVSGSFYQSDDESHVVFALADLPLYSVPKLQDAVNAPVRGIFTLDIDLTAPDGEWSKSSGRVEVHCFACTIGDGETKLFIPKSKPTSMLSKGVTIPEMDLGTLDGVMEFVDGKAVAEEFGTQSEDIVFKVSGEIEFKDPIGKSRLDLLIKVFVEPSLRERSDQVDLLVLTASPKVKMEEPDEGWLAVVLEGNFNHPRFRGINSKTRAQRLREKREQRTQRARDRAEDRATKREVQQTKQDAAKAARDAASGESGADQPESGRAELEIDPDRELPPEAGVIIEQVPSEEENEEEGGSESVEEAGEEGGDEASEEGGEEGGEETAAGEESEETEPLQPQ